MMRKQKNRDLNQFLESHKIVKMVEEEIREPKGGLSSSLLDRAYKEDFLKNITSEELFQKENERLEAVYQKRDLDGFMSKIIEKERRLKRRRRIQMVIASTSVAAAMIAIYLNLLVPEVPNPIIPEVVIANSEIPITVPTLITQDNVIELKGNDTLLQIVEGSKLTANTTQRLVIPSGYTYMVTLADGTEVTLNAGSELTYPSNFSKEKREIQLKGEAYFNVAKSNIPFVVNVENTLVKVYGTRFNINSYNSENIQTVLISGSVGVSIQGNEKNETMIKPNQMVTTNREGRQKISNIDANRSIAWISGEIVSDNESLLYFLNKVEKWYGVEFSCSDEIREQKISAEINNRRPLEELLTSIELISEVKIIKMGEKKYMIKK